MKQHKKILQNIQNCELKIVQKNDDKASYETVPQSLTTFNDVITNLSTNNENISSWINKLNEETILYPDLLEAFGDNLSVVLVNQTTQKPEIKTVKIEFIKETPSPEPSVPDYIVDPNGNNYLYPTKEELEEIKEKCKNSPLPVDNSTGITIPVYAAIESMEDGINWIKNIVYNIISTMYYLINNPLKNLSKVENIEVLVCIKVLDSSDDKEYAFKKLVISNGGTNEDSITVPQEVLVEKTEGQFVDKDNNVKFKTDDLADIEDLQKNNVAVKTNIIDSINIVINTYKTLGIIMKHTFSIFNSCVLSPSAHFAINSSKFLWNNFITPGLRYGIDEYGKIKKYIINWGDDNEFLPTPAEDDSEILKYLKDKAIATQEIAINTWEDLIMRFG
ncbi:hypothetical protein M9Y10_036877 [Tritrichomonas musculus]|uniref:Uncharacterized protein n=1 Tax=Tritrichomonas musculus TaxID=1915356 RepID=A0ABR2GT73_9EUKA